MEQLFCAAEDCRCPIDMNALANSIYIGHSVRFCAVCFDMFLNVMKPWFMDAQGEWRREQMKRKRLRSGSNYLD